MKRVKKTKTQQDAREDVGIVFVEKWSGKRNHEMTTDEIMAMTRGDGDSAFLIEQFIGIAKDNLTTDEIMAMTRGED